MKVDVRLPECLQTRVQARAPPLAPQKALRGFIPCSFLEPLARSWSHFVGIYCPELTTSLKNDFDIPPRRALRGSRVICLSQVIFVLKLSVCWL